LLRFANAGIAVASMRGRSYLSIGSTAMGIAGSIVDSDFSKPISVCAMNRGYVRIIRRVNEGIFDKKNTTKPSHGH